MDEITVAKRNVKYAGWIAMVNNCQDSGLPVRTWCNENGVRSKTYYYRLRKLRTMFLAQHKEEVIPEIEPLPVIAESKVELPAITFKFEGMSVEIPVGADETAITSILRAVKTAW